LGFVVTTILLAPTASFATPEEEENRIFEEPTALIPQDRDASVDDLLMEYRMRQMRRRAMHRQDRYAKVW